MRMTLIWLLIGSCLSIGMMFLGIWIYNYFHERSWEKKIKALLEETANKIEETIKDHKDKISLGNIDKC